MSCAHSRCREPTKGARYCVRHQCNGDACREPAEEGYSVCSRHLDEAIRHSGLFPNRGSCLGLWCVEKCIDGQPFCATHKSKKRKAPEAESERDSKRLRLANSYLDKKLRPEEELSYKAAGVLPLFVDAEQHRILAMVGLERIKDERKHKLVPEATHQFVVLGGKREPCDEMGSLETAGRELWEETGGEGVLTNGFATVRKDRRVFWWLGGKYALYLHVCDKDDELLMLADTFDQRKSKFARDHKCRMKELAWIDIALLMDGQTGRSDNAPLSNMLTELLVEPELRAYLTGLVDASA